MNCLVLYSTIGNFLCCSKPNGLFKILKRVPDMVAPVVSAVGFLSFQ